MTLELISAAIVIVAWGFHIIMINLFGSPTFVIKSKALFSFICFNITLYFHIQSLHDTFGVP